MIRFEAEKKCSKCQATLPVGSFYRRKEGKLGRVSACKTCTSLATPRDPVTLERKRLQAFEWRHRENWLTPGEPFVREQYLKLLTKQKGLCALCHKPPTRGRQLDADHDHRTGRIRGLLCNPCNLFVGRLEENGDFLAKAYAYLGGVPS